MRRSDAISLFLYGLLAVSLVLYGFSGAYYREQQHIATGNAIVDLYQRDQARGEQFGRMTTATVQNAILVEAVTKRVTALENTQPVTVTMDGNAYCMTENDNDTVVLHCKKW